MNLPLGRLLVLAGLALAALGLLVMFLPRLPWLGRLPGDLLVRRGRFVFYAPLATCLVLSVLLTLLGRIIRR